MGEKTAFRFGKSQRVYNHAGSVCRKTPKLAAVARKQRFAGLRGKVLRHKGLGLCPYNPGRRQCLLHLHFFDTLSRPYVLIRPAKHSKKPGNFQ